MKKTILLLLILSTTIFATVAGCASDPLYDIYTQNIYPGENDTGHYQIGSPTDNYDGYFYIIRANYIISENVTGNVTEVDPIFIVSPAFGITAGNISDWLAHAGLTTGVHGVSGDIVGTSDLQALTNKLITLANNVALKLSKTDGTAYNAFYTDTGNVTQIKSSGGDLRLNEGVSEDVRILGNNPGGSRVEYIDTAGASAGTTLQDSQYIRQRARYWNGSASAVWDFDIYHDMTASGATPASHADFRINGVEFITGQNNNGTISVTTGGALIEGSNYNQFTEMAAPGAGAANTARIYASDGGDGLTDLNAVFQDGTVVTFAEETTPLDSPIFTQPSGTVVQYVMKKPHPGLIQFVAQFLDGSSFVLKEIEYHDAEKIAANTGCEAPLPKDWVVTTAAERAAKPDPTAIQHDGTGQGTLTEEQDK